MEILNADVAADVRRAAEILLSGGLVAIPTETVYGLGADASNDSAVRRVFTVKGRPTDHPLILHVADHDAAKAASGKWTAAAEILARTFWPGALSILTEKSPRVSDAVTGARSTVVVRVPDHRATLTLLRVLHEHGSVGLAAPSANKFGAVSPTTARHVIDDLGDAIDAVLDGGPCRVGLESTIVDCRSAVPVILREGGVTVESIGTELARHGLSVETSTQPSGIAVPVDAVAPGMLESHYAPRARVEVFDTEVDLAEREAELVSEGVPCARLAATSDLVEYSRGLYMNLRECDSTGVAVILAVLPPPIGLGAAIRDRLRKAAAAR